jgi:hypothetical protein
LFVFWYHSPNFLDTPHIHIHIHIVCNISGLRANKVEVNVKSIKLVCVITLYGDARSTEY